MTQKSPNIVLIMSDNHAADLLGCYGNPEIHTPHLDRLAGEGVQFNQAYCVNAMCSPCRASVLTGMMPSEHGVHTWIDDRRMQEWPDNWNALSGIPTLAQLLKDEGYDTALIGKYHLGSPFQSQNGFDHWVTFPHGHTRNFWGNTIIDNGRQYQSDEHSVDVFTQKAVEYLESRANNDRPFFLLLTYNGPYGHWPAIGGTPRNRFGHLYTDTPMHSVPREGIHPDMISRMLLTMSDSGQGLDYSATIRLPNDLAALRNFYSQMSMVDDGVGQVMQTIDNQQMADDTLIVYSSDHGFSLGHHGVWGHGQATWPAVTYRSSFSIPLIMRQTGRLNPQQCDRTVSQLDLFATLLDYANPQLVKQHQTHASRSLTPLLDNPTADWDDVIFMEQEETRSVRTADWHYMHRFQGSQTYPLADALFDLQNDPDEHHNLINDAAYAEIGAELRQQITRFFQAHSRPDYDLWQGGTAKSNTSRFWLWPDVWGSDWHTVLP